MLGIYHQVRSAVRVKEKREKTMSPAGLFSSSSSSTPAMQQEEEEEEGSLSVVLSRANRDYITGH
jgi:hypothetical protein